ncbi:uncharacterized protein AB675_3661 [Cyphellophora attinorum]|uniref:Secreted protein n=1 Tax=Cyphellophora attinorum TaxID=1664694 RepID=A0A0N1HPD4_9EURO|nr:uncharacterized protein AB675_3661 [Phialophora attinorum]KPI37087.1 hypothetical protein AB675_3661 [Phialophora attinorum]
MLNIWTFAVIAPLTSLVTSTSVCGDQGGPPGSTWTNTCDLAVLVGQNGTGPEKTCASTKGVSAQLDSAFGCDHVTTKNDTGARPGYSKCRNIVDQAIDFQGSTGDFVVYCNGCTNGTGWTHVKVYDQKGCPRPELKPRAQVYDIVKGFPDPTAGMWCASVSILVFIAD